MNETKAANPSGFKVGGIAVEKPVVLAPMSGVTDAPFRRLAAELGAGLVVSEMTASDDLARGRPVSKLRCEATGIGPHVVQLAGCEAHWMAEGARVAEAAGADIIDINMGCPARHVTGRQSGSALMRDLDHALDLIEATVGAVSVPVTLKMRLGWDHQSINAPELARRAENAGIQLVTVHGRTRCQFYKGTADWTAIRAVKAAISIPLVVNGDILSFDDAKTALAQSGADAVMIGRGAQGQPWLPGQVARRLAGGEAEGRPSMETQLAYAERLHEGILSHYGSRVGQKHARKHLGWSLDVAAETTGASVDQLKSWRQRVLTSENPELARTRLAEAFADFAWKAAA